MELVDLDGAREFSPVHHVHKSLTSTARSDISIACWEPGQTSPIHAHPAADEIYHVIEGEGLFSDGRTEKRLGPGGTVIFPAGDVHRVTALTRMVLYRVQAGADRHAESWPTWPDASAR
jgi:quercetin dioxygenase-like cupin family protein